LDIQARPDFLKEAMDSNTVAVIAQYFSVHYSTVSRIVRGHEDSEKG
jgi:hypothetical protein